MGIANSLQHGDVTCNNRDLNILTHQIVGSLNRTGLRMFEGEHGGFNQTGGILLIRQWIERSIRLKRQLVGSHYEMTHTYTGWWCGTFFIFPYIGNNHPN
jgi:hypothetical protein